MKLLRLVFLLLFIDYGSAKNMPQDAPLSLVDGCPFELQSCQRLTFDSAKQAVCPHKLWKGQSSWVWHQHTQTGSWLTVWTEIRRMYLSSGDKLYYYVDMKNDGWILPDYARIACAPAIPIHIIRSRWSAESTDDSDITLFVPGGGCGHGFAVNRNEANSGKYCSCAYGWGGASCEIPVDPFGIATSAEKYQTPPAYTSPPAVTESCNILMAEGCPDEEQDSCLKLQFYQNVDDKEQEKRDQAYCPYKLWLSNETSWEQIDRLYCNWHTKEWHITRPSDDIKIEYASWEKPKKIITALDPKRRVQCASAMPTTNHLTFRRLRNAINEQGNKELATTHYCFRNWDQCQNGGHCVHSHRPSDKQKSVLTYCECRPGFSGEKCEVKKSRTDAIPENHICNLQLAESCQPSEINCEPLRYNKTTQSVECSSMLWVSKTQSIHNDFSGTNSFTTKWTKIESMKCKNNRWEIFWTRNIDMVFVGQVLHLHRKVMCANFEPELDMGAFWEQKTVGLPLATFASVLPSPVAFCPDDSPSLGCGRGYCVITYKDGRFVQSCSCEFGYGGADCIAYDDPYGFDPLLLKEPNFKSKLMKPLPDSTHDWCNILLAEGCPDEFEDACVKLRLFDTGVLCRRHLWASTGKSGRNGFKDYQEWEKIDRLECVGDTWEMQWIAENRTKKLNPYNHERVQCSWNKPVAIVQDADGPYYFEGLDDGEQRPRGGAGAIFTGFCFHNLMRCQTPSHCTLTFNHALLNEPNDFRAVQNCLCLTETPDSWWCQPDCSMRNDLGCEDYDYRPGQGPYFPDRRPGGGKALWVGKKEMCEPSALEDGCTDDNCVKLTANATHDKCTEQLWLNYGGDFFLDWHEISGVKCVDNQWQTECAKKIGKSKLVCSKQAPSSISSSLFLTIIIIGVVIILLIALTCACCLLHRKQRRVQQAASLARTPHSSRCPSSTGHSDNARTARAEDSDEK